MDWTSLTGQKGAWSGLDWTARAPGTARADPYLAWADATGFADLGGAPTGWVRVILELNETAPDHTELTAKSFAERLEGVNAGWQAWIRVSSLYRFPPADLDKTRFLTACVTKQFFAELDASLAGFIKRFEIGMPVVPDDLPSEASAGTSAGTSAGAAPLATGTGPAFAGAQFAAPNAASPPMVFLGVMDDGLAFAHERFRSVDDPSATRIEYFWNQDDAPGSPPVLHYGSELSKSDIDAMLARCTLGGLVDEEAVYAQAGYINVRRRWAHGTEVMDLAGGVRPGKLHTAFLHTQGEEQNVLDNARLIGVQFKTAGRTVRDTSGRWFAVHALDAMRYVLRRADDAAQGAKYCVVLNLSYGYMAGPHDGSSIIERAIDELIGLHRDLCVVVPAGNSNVLRCHARVEVQHGASQSITWRVLPDCATPGFLEIWLPEHADASQVKLTVSPPAGAGSPLIASGSVYAWQPDGNVLCTVAYLDQVATGNRNMILIALAPTLTRKPSRDAAPAGNWSVTLSNSLQTGDPLVIDAWIQRNETAYGFPVRGRQSRFEDPRYRRFVSGAHIRDFDAGNMDSWIRRSRTLNSIATGENTVVVGGYRRTDGTAAAYSSTGPTLSDTGRDGPDAMAVSEDSPGCAGVLGASTRSGCLVALSGTSAAAPQVARLLVRAKLQGQSGTFTAYALKPHKAREWIAKRAAAEDPVPVALMAHQLGGCPVTAIPPVVPVGQHSWVPRLIDERGGAGRFPSPRWKRRGIKL
ncbi:S8 family serine peptidase [Paraburkholderia sp. LEh10]|uniref:S8 family serine peptidase n=1 Tax=Paraburkholderia sp. LEh10 TaxID=2821353 RepID=UPI001AE712D6|nr:S8 family serine peptidase [Paraburkholderia sp. LEh10]MBP0588649.1 S8 family serine peptidase [Paraburkholderia sp. LEh10]